MQKENAQLFFVEPMECKEVRDVALLPRGDRWQYEVKFDGYRCIAIKQNNAVELFSRNSKPFGQFINLFEPLRTQRARSFILDGEIVALGRDGRSNFNALQNWGRKPVEVHFYAFDLLHLNGETLINRPLSERQKRLWKELKSDDYIHLPRPLNARLDLVLDRIREFGFEGVIAKEKSSLYVPGGKPGSSVKKKIKQTDEFIVGGFTRGNNGVDELVVGKYAGKDLKFVAVIDDGFVPMMREQVFKAVSKFKTEECPFTNLPEKKGLHRMDQERMARTTWVKPKVVVEIAMNEWTPDRHLRHGEFVRLRPDKRVGEVSEYPN